MSVFANDLADAIYDLLTNSDLSNLEQIKLLVQILEFILQSTKEDGK